MLRRDNGTGPQRAIGSSFSSKAKWGQSGMARQQNKLNRPL